MKRHILKFITTLVLLASIPIHVAAQKMTETNKIKKVHWGISMSANINYSGGGLSHYIALPGWGLAAGGHSRVMLTKKCFFEPGLRLGYDYSWLRAADKNNPRIQLNRWRVGIPVIFGYKITSDTHPRGASFVPQIGIEYNHYFSTSTAGQVLNPRYKSSSLWYPNIVAGCIGCGLYYDECQLDIMFNVDITRANRPENNIVYTHNYHPIFLSFSFKMFI